MNQHTENEKKRFHYLIVVLSVDNTFDFDNTMDLLIKHFNSFKNKFLFCFVSFVPL